jgi:hypothetical protein
LISEDGTDVALALAVTHDIAPDVQFYSTQAYLPIRRIISCTASSRPAPQAVFDATHAKLLADQLSAHIRSDRTISERQGRLHIFAAAPNALVFFIGQVARSFGRCILYDYDFDSNAPGAYQRSLIFPPPTQPKHQ